MVFLEYDVVFVVDVGDWLVVDVDFVVVVVV